MFSGVISRSICSISAADLGTGKPFGGWGIGRLRPSPNQNTKRAAKPRTSEKVRQGNPRLWDSETTRAFFGGIDISTLYRGMAAGRYPRPVLVSEHIARWLAEECEATLERLIETRDEPCKSRGFVIGGETGFDHAIVVVGAAIVVCSMLSPPKTCS